MEKIFILLAAAMLGSCGTTRPKHQAKRKELDSKPALHKRDRPSVHQASALNPKKIKGPTVEMEKIHFEFDSHYLSASAMENLRKNLELLKRYPQRHVVVEGHTDAIGSARYNFGLGGMRALTVANFLLKQGVSGARLRIVSLGEQDPYIVTSDWPLHQHNRRVELRLLSPVSRQLPRQPEIQGE